MLVHVAGPLSLVMATIAFHEVCASYIPSAEAMSLLDEFLAISSGLGMRPLMERVLSRREILKA